MEASEKKAVAATSVDCTERNFNPTMEAVVIGGMFHATVKTESSGPMDVLGGMSRAYYVISLDIPTWAALASLSTMNPLTLPFWIGAL